MTKINWNKNLKVEEVVLNLMHENQIPVQNSNVILHNEFMILVETSNYSIMNAENKLGITGRNLYNADEKIIDKSLIIKREIVSEVGYYLQRK